MADSEPRKVSLKFNNSENKKKLDNNNLNLVSRLNNKEQIIGHHPLNVQIQTTSACNGKCLFCPYVGSWHQKHPGIMSDSTFESIVDALKGYKIQKLCPYFENEPLTDKKIFTRLEYMVNELKPMWVEFSSNLSILTDGMLDQIEDLFPRIKHVFWISFHGIDKASYEEIMGLDYERTLQNIFKLVELTQDLPIYLMINGSGEPIIDDSLKTWFSEKDYHQFWDNQLKPFKKKPSVRFFKYHDRAGQVQLKDKNLSFNNIFRSSLENFYCSRFDKWVHFLFTGEPVLCCMDYNRETAIEYEPGQNPGNIFDSDKFRELIGKACGVEESAKDFICKRCACPVG